MKINYSWLENPIARNRARSAENWINEPGNKEKYLQAAHDYAYQMIMKNAKFKKEFASHNIDLTPNDVLLWKPNQWDVRESKNGKFNFTPNWTFSARIIKKLGLKDKFEYGYHGHVSYDYLSNRAYKFEIVNP